MVPNKNESCNNSPDMAFSSLAKFFLENIYFFLQKDSTFINRNDLPSVIHPF